MHAHNAISFFSAALRGSEECVIFLLENKADVNLKNKLGETPLHFAIRSGRTNIIRVLFVCRLTLSLPVSLRSSFSSPFLQEYGADASVAGNQGTCLQIARDLSKELSVHGMDAEVEEGAYFLFSFILVFISISYISPLTITIKKSPFFVGSCCLMLDFLHHKQRLEIQH